MHTGIWAGVAAALLAFYLTVIYTELRDIDARLRALELHQQAQALEGRATYPPAYRPP